MLGLGEAVKRRYVKNGGDCELSRPVIIYRHDVGDEEEPEAGSHHGRHLQSTPCLEGEGNGLCHVANL